MAVKYAKPILVVAVVVALVAVAWGSYYYLNLARPGFPGSSISYNDSQLQAAAENGKPTLIYFSTQDCPTCLMEDRVMDALFPDYNGTVNFVYMRLSSSNGKLFQDWSVLVVPTVVLADGDGIISKRYDGYASESNLRTDLQGLL
jgi:thiol-disulfide isomerase/thioredoxin